MNDTTLSLGIETQDAVNSVKALETAYKALNTEMGKSHPDAGSKAARDIEALERANSTLTSEVGILKESLREAQESFKGFSNAARDSMGGVKVALSSGVASISSGLKLPKETADDFKARFKTLGEEGISQLKAGLTRSNFLSEFKILDGIEKNTVESLASIKKHVAEAQEYLIKFGEESAKLKYSHLALGSKAYEDIDLKLKAAEELALLDKQRKERLAIEAKYIKMSEVQRIQAAIDAKKLMEPGLGVDVPQKYASQTIATANMGTLASLEKELELRRLDTSEIEKQIALQRLNTSGFEASRLQENLDIERQLTKELKEQVAWIQMSAKAQAERALAAGKVIYTPNSTSEMISASGSTQAIEAARAAGSLKELEKRYLELGPAIKSSKTHQMHWNAVANEAHAAARGLSGALGGLWMTYGSMAPLIAAATMAGSLKEMVSGGKDLEFQFKMVEAVSDGATVSIEKFHHAIQGAMFSPLEAAKGLRMLAQSGLAVQDALTALPTILKLATLGETDVSTAALAAVSTMNTFGMQANDIRHIGEVFTITAAATSTSVTGIMESMKQASAASNLYGVTLEETAAVVGTLAQRGIIGSSAGTAFTNMMKEMIVPATDKAKFAMEQFGIKMTDSADNIIPLKDRLSQLSSVFNRMGSGTQTKWLEDMFNNRGMKAASILLSDMSALNKLLDEINLKSRGIGFLAEGEAILAASFEGQLKALKNSFALVLDEVYLANAEGMKEIIRALKSFVDSGGLKEALSRLASAISDLTNLALNHAEGIKNLLIAYTGYKVISLATSAIIGSASAIAGLNKALVSGTVMLTGISLAMKGIAPAAEGATVAVVGLRAAALAFGAAALPIGLTVAAVTALVSGIGYLAYKVVTYETAGESFAKSKKIWNADQDSINLSIEKGIEVLDRENEVLVEQIRLMREGISAAKSYSSAKHTSDVKEKQGSIDSLTVSRDAVASSLKDKKGVGDPFSGRPDTKGILSSTLAALEDQIAIEKNNLETFEKKYNEAMVKSGLQADHLKPLKDSLKEATELNKKLEAINEQRKKLGKSAVLSPIDIKSLGEAELKAQTVQLSKDIVPFEDHYARKEKKPVKTMQDAGEDILLWAKKEREMAEEKLRAASVGEVADTKRIEALYKISKAMAAKGKMAEAEQAAILKEVDNADLSIEATNKVLKAKQALAKEEAKVKADNDKFSNTTDTIAKEAEKLMDAAEATKLYGIAMKQSAIQAAEFAIARASLTKHISEASKEERLVQSAQLDGATGYKAIVDAGVDADKVFKETQAQGLLAVTSSEAAKIDIWVAAANKKIELDNALIDSARRVHEANATSETPAFNTSKAAQEQNIAESIAKIKQTAQEKLRVSEVENAAKTAKEVEGIFKTGFMNIFEGGIKGWREMSISMLKTFNKMVMDALYEQFAKPIVFKMIGSVASSMGMDSIGSAATKLGDSSSLGRGLGDSITGMGSLGGWINKLKGYTVSPGSAQAMGPNDGPQLDGGLNPSSIDNVSASFDKLAPAISSATDNVGNMTSSVANTVVQNGIALTGMTTKASAETTAIFSLSLLGLSAKSAAFSLAALSAASAGSAGSSLLSSVAGIAIKSFIGAGIGASGGGTTVPGFGPNDLGTGIVLKANGGIVGALGDMPLSKYASGGIAKSPQMAIFGEGAMNEAYVPLPDGRSIPVTLKGMGTRSTEGGNTVNISLVVNEGDKSNKQSSSGDSSNAWGQMVNKIKAIVLEELVSQKRPGGLLYT